MKLKIASLYYLSKALKIGLFFSILWLIVNFVLFVADYQEFKPEIFLYILFCFIVSNVLFSLAFNESEKYFKQKEDNERRARIAKGNSPGFQKRHDLAMEALNNQIENSKN